MGIFSKVRGLFSGSNVESSVVETYIEPLSVEEQHRLLPKIRSAPKKLSAWLAIVLEGQTEINGILYGRLAFLLSSLGVEEKEQQQCLESLMEWVQAIGYTHVQEIRSEVQYRLATVLHVEDEESEQSIILEKIMDGLAKTRGHFTKQIHTLLSGTSKFNAVFWEEFEEICITSDMGVIPTQELIRRLQTKLPITAEKEDFFKILGEEVEAIFTTPKSIEACIPPEVIMVVGVNGAGKTTTVAKLAHTYVEQGKKVLLVGADTFRAAAIEQLAMWSERMGVDFFAKGHGSDSAAVAYESIEKALAEKYDIVIIDTAGRLHTKINLMEELTKVYRVLGKQHEGAPNKVVLVLDATMGQNALSQVELFNKACPLDEVILTKLDGTAKGGIAIAIALQYGIPITYIGLGEGIKDLQPFNAKEFAHALLNF